MNNPFMLSMEIRTHSSLVPISSNCGDKLFSVPNSLPPETLRRERFPLYLHTREMKFCHSMKYTKTDGLILSFRNQQIKLYVRVLHFSAFKPGGTYWARTSDPYPVKVML